MSITLSDKSLRLSSPLDECECGNYRMVHIDGGKRLACLIIGRIAPPCQKFVLWKLAEARIGE